MKNRINVKDSHEIIEQSALENLETSQLIKNEANFMLYPTGNVWGRSNVKTLVYRKVIRSNGEEKEVIWRVLGTEKYGLPGPGAMETDLVITKLINQNGWPVPKWFSTTLYEIAKIKNVNPAGNNIRLIKNDLRVLRSTSFESCLTFKCKWESKMNRYLDSPFRKYDAIILKGEPVSEKYRSDIPGTPPSRSDRVYIGLSDVYQKSLNSYHTKEIDFDFMMSLPGALIKRLYQLLNFAFATVIQDGRVRYPYSDLCQRIPLVAEKYLSDAKRQLSPHIKLLIQTGILEKCLWLDANENEAKDIRNLLIHFYPGPRSRAEMSRSLGQYEFTLPVEDSNPFQLSIKENSFNAKDLVLYMHKKASILTKPTSLELSQANQLLKDYGETLSKYVVDYGLEKLGKSKTTIRLFGIIMQWKSEAAEHFNSLNNKKKEQSVLFERKKKEEILEKAKAAASEIESAVLWEKYKVLPSDVQDKLAKKAQEIARSKSGIVTPLSINLEIEELLKTQ